MEEKCNFKKPLSLRDLSASKIFEINKSDNNSVSQISPTTVKRFFKKNSAFKLLPKTIYKHLIFSDERYTSNEFKDTILFSDTIYIQRKYGQFDYNHAIGHFRKNPNENDRSNKINSFFKKIIHIRTSNDQGNQLSDFIESETQKLSEYKKRILYISVSEDDSEILEEIENELEKILYTEYKKDNFFKLLKIVRFAK